MKIDGVKHVLNPTFAPARSIRDRALRHLVFLKNCGALIPEVGLPQVIPARWSIGPEILGFVPQVARAQFSAALKTGQFHLNRENIFIQRGSLRPGKFPNGIPPEGALPTGHPHLWIFDPGTRMWATYILSPGLEEIFNGLRRSASYLKRCDLEVIEILAHARILVPSGYAASRDHYWSRTLKRLHKSLVLNKFTVLPGILSPMQIAILRQYFRALEASGSLTVDKEQVRYKRYFMHNNPLLRFVHRQSGNLVRRVSGQPILPSYTYLSAYMEGADLPRHKDHPQCAWNASLLIDQLPEVAVEDSWPMYLQTQAKVHEVRLDFGDAVFYSGSSLPHWRRQITKGHRQTLGLLHYVPIDFTGGLD